MTRWTFWTREDGSISIETAIIVPLLVWTYLALFTVFDTFRQYTTQQKAAYTISDLVSRQATQLDASFMDGLHDLFEYLSRTREGAGLRVTVASFDQVNSQYEVVWSRTRGGMSNLQSADIEGWSNRLPVLPQDDQIIIFETTSDFTPAFNIGLRDQTINNFIFTRPRYAKQLCYMATCS